MAVVLVTWVRAAVASAASAALAALDAWQLLRWLSGCCSFLLLPFCGRKNKESAEGQGVNCHGSSGLQDRPYKYKSTRRVFLKSLRVEP